MRRVNDEAVNKLEGNPLSSIRKHSVNGGKKAVSVGLALALTTLPAVPALAHHGDGAYQGGGTYHHQGLIDYSNYDIIKYNPNWGTQYTDHSINVNVNRNNIGVVRIADAGTDLRKEIDECIGSTEAHNNRFQYVIFDVLPNRNNDGYSIDLNSFEIYRGQLANLGNLYTRTVTIRSKVFISPENQTWASEQNYVNYINNMRVIFECSDGIYVDSYESFKTWEIELARRANNEETITDVPHMNVSLSSIPHIVHTDGSIWRNQTLLDEYINWTANKNYNYSDGVYYGVYGNFVSFEDYARYFNNGYFIDHKLKLSEQYYGANEFLYSTKEFARQSLSGRGHQYKR